VPEHPVYDRVATTHQITVDAHGAFVAATDRNFFVSQVDASAHLCAGHDDQARLSGTLGAFGWE
jgi:hypothetical protein